MPAPDSAPPFFLLPGETRFVRTENILLRWLPTLFDAYTVKESCVLAVTRNADISFDDEKFEDNEEDFRRQMKKTPQAARPSGCCAAGAEQNGLGGISENFVHARARADPSGLCGQQPPQYALCSA